MATFKYQDPSCYTGRLNHVVLVIGYFILRNDGSQNRKTFSNQNDGSQNDGGLHFGSSATRGEWSGVTGATCAWTFREGMACVASTCCLASTPLSRSITGCLGQVDVCGSDLKNPCYVGACINDGKGSYSCICPPNYVESTIIDSFPTCDPGAAGLASFGIDCNQALPRNMVLQLGNPLLVPCTAFFYTLSGDTCWSISAQLFLTTSNLTALNLGLDYSEPIKAGRSLCVERNATFAFTVPRCLRYGVLTAQDTCERLLLEAGSEDDPTGAGNVNAVRWAELYRNNPGLICSSVIPVSASAVGSNTGVQVRGGGELGWGRKRWEGNGGKIGGWTKRILDGCWGKESFLICQRGVFSNYLPLIAR
ncbi:unnamed protein product [Closterium sp. NIES-64]|nr:unnamed protein product [Closterium sp. NIES-64]CAI5987637.1 unnamed protein product [Closterium sp. NIES-64]